MMAVHFKNFEQNKRIIDACIAHGVFTDWFLFADNALRIVPPLNISDQEIKQACAAMLQAIEQAG